MVRPFPQDTINKCSPKGFWPHPNEELFHKLLTPWKVPRKRKPRGRSRLYYDHALESVQYRQCEEAITSNRFQILSEEDSANPITQAQEEKSPLKNDYSLQQTLYSDYVSTKKNEDDYTETDSLSKFLIYDDKISNNNNFFMYNKNKKFCSGYFPDFITLHDPMYYQLSNSQSHNFYRSYF